MAEKTYTATEAAEKLGVSSARIRQFCIATHADGVDPIGTVFGHMWMLDDADLEKITELRQLDGRKKENKRDGKRVPA